MIDSIYHITLRILLNLISGVKTLHFCHYVRTVVINAITFPVNQQATSGLSFYCMTLFNSMMPGHMIMFTLQSTTV